MENLVRVFDLATAADLSTASRSWYTYRELTRRAAQKFGFEPKIGAAVFAALSPNNDYLGNLRDMHRLLEAAHRGLGLDDFGVSTYHNNKRKAWAICHGTAPLDVIVYPKTRSFYLNICDPTDPVPVTVDGHIYNAWRGERIALTEAATKMNNRLYETIAEDVRILARKVGLLPNVVQATIWHAWKRLHSIKYQSQLEFWDVAVITARLGYALSP